MTDLKPRLGTDIEWHHLNAKGAVLGRLATEAAGLLQGKHRPDWAPNTLAATRVVITNTDEVAVTGRKEDQKMYRRYSGYPGGLRERTLRDQRRRDSRKIVESAVSGMLPHNTLRAQLMRHLLLYANESHPHEAQLPTREN